MIRQAPVTHLRPAIATPPRPAPRRGRTATSRRLLRLALSAAVLALVSGCGASPTPAGGPAPQAAAPTQAAAPAQLRPVKLAISATTLAFAPVDVAIDEGLFAKEGLKAELVNLTGGSEVISALRSGSVQFAGGAGGSLILSEAKGVTDIVCVANLQGQSTQEVGIRKALAEQLHLQPGMPLQDRLKLLKGLRIAITGPGSVSDQLVTLSLASAGLDPKKDAQIVTIGGSGALVAAIKNDQVDVIALSPPTVEEAEQQGSAVLFYKGSELPALADIVQDGLFVSRDTITQDPKLILSVLRAIDEGGDFLRTHTDEALKALEDNQFNKTDPALIKAGVQALMPAWPVHLAMTETTWKNSLDLLSKSGLLKGPAPDVSRVWTDQFIKELG